MEGKEMPTAEQLDELLTTLYEKYFDYLVDYAQNFGYSPEVAEDLVQETFTVAVRKAEDLYYAVSQRGWLIRTLRNIASNYQRKIMYAQRLLVKLEQQHLTDRRESLDPKVLYDGLIDTKDLKLLIRYYADGEPINSIAESLGLSEGACKKHIYRTRDKFIKALEAENDKLK